MRIGDVFIYRERGGVISPGPIWIILTGPYMFIDGSLLSVVWQALTLRGVERERHLVG